MDSNSYKAPGGNSDGVQDLNAQTLVDDTIPGQTKNFEDQ